MRKRKHNRTAGFSLIEVVVGIAVMGLVTAPVCASLVLSVRLNSHSRALMDARLQASGVVETLLAEGIHVNAQDGNGEFVWGEKQEDCWTRTIDGVEVTVTEVTETVGENKVPQPYYEVVVFSTVAGEDVEFTTHVRKAGGS